MRVSHNSVASIVGFLEPLPYEIALAFVGQAKSIFYGVSERKELFDVLGGS